MTLPADIIRCEGVRYAATGYEHCTQRSQCERYLDLFRTESVHARVINWLCTDEAYSARIPVVPAPMKEAA